MEWTEEITINLIKAYKEFRLLWNPEHIFYYDKKKREDAWEKLAKMFNCTPMVVQKKIDLLLCSFRKELLKISLLHKISQSESRTDKTSMSPWFASQYMTFLLDKFKTWKSSSTDSSSEHELSVPELKEKWNNASITNMAVAKGDASIHIKNDIQRNTESSLTYKSAVPEIIRSKKRSLSLSIENLQISGNDNNLGKTVTNKREQDNSDIFGYYVANKHRKYDGATRSIVEYLINNVLSEADYKSKLHIEQKNVMF